MSTTETAVKMIMDRWKASILSLDTLLKSLPDEKLVQEIAPNKNRGIYLLGHLIAVHDDMLMLLDMGPKLFPALSEPFLKSPDKATDQIPPLEELRSCWFQQCNILDQKFEQLTHAEWFDKHTAVTDEDFAKEPHRNKLNIVLTRTTHLQYHIGQLILLK